MVMVFFNSVRRWLLTGSGAAVTALPVAVASRRVAPRAPAIARRLPARPLTPFGGLARVRPSPQTFPVMAPTGRRSARRFWMTIDPQDRRHAALGGSFAEVCAALEQLAALEERRL